MAADNQANWAARRRIAAGWAHHLWHDKAGLFGLAIVVLLIVVAAAAPLLAPYDPAAQALRDRLLPPAWLAGGQLAHLLGTDQLGRDVLSRLIFGSRVSLVGGAGVVLRAGAFGTALGMLAGYCGGRVDDFVMRWVDTQVAFPGLLLALVILVVVGANVPSLIIVLSLNGWMVYARMARGSVLGLRQLPYVEAAQMIGCRGRRVIFRHILPNLTSPLLTLSILEFARIILAEAALSFLGMGVQPPGSSWGLDVAIGKDYMFRAWWLVTFPGAAIALTVLGVNLLASWLRVVTDPREREKQFARRMARKRHAEPVPAAAASVEARP